jgi:cell division protein FtsB
MITTIGLLANYKKQILIILLLSLCFYLFHTWSYNKGYAKATEVHETLQKAALKEALDAYDKKVKEVIAHKEKDAEQAEVVKQAEIVVETKVQTVTRYVDKIIVTNECSGLASDVVGLLSQSTDIVRETARSPDSQNRTKADDTLRRTF